jgi:hypothetical protein
MNMNQICAAKSLKKENADNQVMENPVDNGNASITRNESNNQRYIRLLSRLAAASVPISTDETTPRDDMLGFEELLNDGCIDGVRGGGAINEVLYVASMGITLKGRTFLDDLKKKEEMNTSLGLIKHNRFGLLKWGLAFLTGIFSKIVYDWLTLHKP